MKRPFWEFLLLVIVGVLLVKYIILGPAYAIGLILASPFMLLSGLKPDWNWGEVFLSIFISAAYIGAWLWRGWPPKWLPLFVQGALGRALGAAEGAQMTIDKYRKDDLAVRRERLAASNDALEQLMGDLLTHQPSGQGWLAEVAGSLREQARAGRLKGNLERIVAILEQERKRMEHLAEINKLTGQLRHGDLAADVEAKRMALERLKLEQEAQKLAAEMDELLGLKVRERQLKEKEIELRMAQIEQDLVGLRQKPERTAPELPPEEAIKQKADFWLKVADQVKRIRETVTDTELAESMVDRIMREAMEKDDGR